MWKTKLYRNMIPWIVYVVVLAATANLCGVASDETSVRQLPAPERIPAGPIIAPPAVGQPNHDPLLQEAAAQTVSGASQPAEAAARACPPQQQSRPAPAAPCPRPGLLPALGRLCAEDCTEVPFAAPVFAAARTQIKNGVTARMVLYQYDFCDDDGPAGDALNPHGLARLGKLVRMLPCAGFCPIMIECTQNPALDEARRARVVEVLTRMNIPTPEQFVAVGSPQTPELRGLEAEIINFNLTELFKNQKVSGFAPGQGDKPGGGGGGGGGSSSGSGSSGAAGGS